MGLTIHYSLQSTAKTLDRAKRAVEQMRQLALDLPFARVDNEIHYLGPEVCHRPLEELRGNELAFLTVSDATTHSVACPWGRKRQISYLCQPLEIISFTALPGPGSEAIRLGLARYPGKLDVTYQPQDDDRFIRSFTKRGERYLGFDWRKWEQWLLANGHQAWESPSEFHEQRSIKTRLGSVWRHSSFCKTQYASDPACGGVANFLKCHVSVITLLDRIAKLPTIKVELCDEGKYGRSHYSDDWQEARAAGREPTYVWHEGQYSVPALAQEVGEWDELIAANYRILNDALKASGSPLCLEGPIQGYANFEHLEFKGRENRDLAPLLRAMDQLGRQQRAAHAASHSA